jgi:hypothetical protein
MSRQHADAPLDQLVLVSADEDGRIVYFHPRWRMLCEAWNQPPGTEHDDVEQQSFHPMLREPSGGVVASGRLHFELRGGGSGPLDDGG